MSASRKQIKLIEDLMNKGAPIPSNDGGNPDLSMFDSIQAADAYIKANYHYLSKKTHLCKIGKQCRPDEYGEVLNT